MKALSQILKKESLCFLIYFYCLTIARMIMVVEKFVGENFFESKD